jgi:hypothetical protein
MKGINTVKASTMTAVEREKLQVETAKLKAEAEKLKVEARKYAREIFWQPVGIALAFFATVATIAAAISTLIIKLLT